MQMDVVFLSPYTDPFSDHTNANLNKREAGGYNDVIIEADKRAKSRRVITCG